MTDAHAEAAGVGVTPSGVVDAEAAQRADAKRKAAVEYQRRVLASADEAVDRAQAKLAKLRESYVVDIAGAEAGIEQALAARESAVAELEAAEAEAAESAVGGS